MPRHRRVSSRHQSADVDSPQSASPTQVVSPTGSDLQRVVGNRATASLIQAKMTVGPEGDVYEQEADRVATEVMRYLATESSPGVQRAGIDGEELMMKPAMQRAGIDEEELMMKPAIQRAGIDEEELMMKAAIQRAPVIGLEGGPLDDQTDAEIRQAKGGGKPLDAGVRGSMEGAFGVDFSSVRIHDGSQADTLNQKIQAKAFTTGSDIFFRSGDYSPTTSGGQELLAHELTHVVQQGGAGV